MEEYYCVHCGASILAETEDDLARCPMCGKNPRSRLQKANDAASAAASKAQKKPSAAMQTVGSLMVLLGLILGGVGYVAETTSGSPSQDWIGPAAMGAAVLLVLVGIVVSITGRVRSGGHV